MPSTTITSRQFNQDAGRAKKAAETGPVIITDRGRPAHVLLSFEAYRNLMGGKQTLLDIVSMPDGDDIEFEPGRMGDVISKPVDFD
jgi:prevent-host-death family protein